MTASNNPTLETPQRILVVDDEEIVLVALRDTLLREGYQVMTHSSPLQAIEAVRKETFSVIITDQQMPMLTGLEFLAQVKRIQPDATRILITAVLSLDTVIDAINKGEIYRFILKPWLREELLVTVKNAVQRHELVCRNAILQASTLAVNNKLKEANDCLAAQVSRMEEQNERLARVNEALDQNLGRSLELCLRMMEIFCPTLGSQARRVHQLCMSMAGILKLPPEQTKVLEISAWLYDIGLVGLPRSLIRRWQENPDGLNEPEMEIIRHHPALGEEMARLVHDLEAVGPAIRAHHERFDGEGYPDRLQGEGIPWLGRLLAVAVGYAESNLDAAAAAEEVKAGAGTVFDPEAVRVFAAALPKAAIPQKEREVLLSELRPGMVLAKGIYTAHGLLLIPPGQQLNPTYIEKLLNHDRISPISQALVVYV